jgi:hypothetical protein
VVAVVAISMDHLTLVAVVVVEVEAPLHVVAQE